MNRCRNLLLGLRALPLFLALVLVLQPGCGGSAEGEDDYTGDGASELLAPEDAAPVGQRDIVWPPQLGKAYPDLRLQTPEGDWVQLSDFRGKVLVIEPIGMSCPACNAWAGGNSAVGTFQGVRPQPDLDSLDDYSRKFAGVSLDDPELMYIHLVLYDTKLRDPSVEDLAAWRDHFGLHGENVRVLGGTPDLISPASYKMIPGVQLVDRSFVLRSDSTGHHPRHNLYKKLLPMLGELVER